MRHRRLKSALVLGFVVAMGGLGTASARDFDELRKVLVSPTVNTPDYFPGFGGFCGWPKVIRLRNGDLFVSFEAGYWHASWPTPLDFPPDYLKRMTGANPVLKEWHEQNKAPEGARNYWIRSQDGGRTWSRPKEFPRVRGSEGIQSLIQLRDGTVFAAHNIEQHRGWIRTDLSQGLPTDPLAFARIAAGRFPQPFVVHRSDDSGETWREIARLTGPFLLSATIQGLMEDPRDGGLVVLAAGAVFPVGKGWPETDGHVLALMKSLDRGETWKVVSVFEQKGPGDEKNVGYLPDGSLAMASRPYSEWIRSRDHGQTWSAPRRLLGGPGDSKGRLMKRGELLKTAGGTAVLVFCGGRGGNGQVMYSRDNGDSWVKPAPDRGFRFDPLAYYPDACVLEDGSVFAVGVRQRIANELGPFGAETLAMRFRIKSAEEGEGIELLPIGDSKTGRASPPPAPPAEPPPRYRWRATKPRLVHAGESAHRYAAMPCMVRLADGTLLASLEWKAAEGTSTALFIESLDGGRSWSDPFEVKVPIDRVSGGTMGLMNDGRILLVCGRTKGSNLGKVENRTGKPLPRLIRKTGRLPDGSETEAYESYRYHSDAWVTFSSDRGRTWTDARKIDHEPIVGASLWTGARPVQLRDGTLVVPLDGYLSMADMDGIWLSSCVLRSSDEGRTWSSSVVGRTEKDHGLVFSEPTMARLRDGRLVLLMRTQNRALDESRVAASRRSGLYRSVSRDGGRSWSPPIRVLTGSHGSITQLGDGRLLCGWHRPVQYALSSDAGLTWTDPAPWFTGRDSDKGWYTNVIALDDETAVAMLKDFPTHPNWIWAQRLTRVLDEPDAPAGGATVDGAPLRWRPTRPRLVRDGGDEGAAACIVRLRDGRLLASVDCEAREAATAVGFIEAADGGRTWGERFRAEVPAPHLVATDVSMGPLNDGRLVMVCTRSLGENLGSGENRSGKPLPRLRRFTGKLPDGREYQAYESYRIRTALNLAFSADDGRTWTRGPEIDSAPLLGAWTWTGGKPTQLADGSIVAPITGYLSRDDMDGIRQSCGVLRCDADGRDWSFSLVARSRKDTGQVFSEPAMARLGDGRLVFMIRGQNRVRDAARVPDDERRGLYHSISEDGGKTWSPAVRVLAGTHCSIVELADDRLLCGWHRPVRYAVSSDAGRSWSRPTPWFVGTGTHQGTYTHVELVDEETAVAMIREEKRASRLWTWRLLATVEPPEVDGESTDRR